MFKARTGIMIRQLQRRKMTLAARCHRAPPHCGERPSGYRLMVILARGAVGQQGVLAVEPGI